MAQPPRGTRDFAPPEMAVRNHVLQKLRQTFASYGYGEVQTPTFEELELFTAKSGDGIIGELYNFKDKGDRDMTLRPELTAPVMRMYFGNHQFDPKPIKWSYFSNCFRYDRPQAGRYREFWQYGCEQIGAGSPLAYAELIALANACLENAGLQNYRIGVGHVGILGAAVNGLGLSDSERGKLMRAIDKKDQSTLEQIIESNPNATALQAVLAATDAATIPGIDEAKMDELAQTLGYLESLGVDVDVDLSIARGLDYYTGIVFEIHADSLGAQSQIVGGGGYDLSALFGAQSTPTMGFGLGFDRMIEAIQAEGTEIVAPLGPAVAMGAMGDEALQQILGWAAELRRRGVSVDVDLLGRKPGKLVGWANSIGAKKLVLLGGRDLESGNVTIKDMAAGIGTEVALDNLVDELAAAEA